MPLAGRWRNRLTPLMGRRGWTVLLLHLVAALAACQSAERPAMHGAITTEPDRAFPELVGWAEDDHAAAHAAFLNSCQWFDGQDPRAPISYPDGSRGWIADWQRVCALARALPGGETATARRFFEQQFRPIALRQADGSPTGLFTGYYAPLLRGDWRRSDRYATPLYRLPPRRSGRRLPARAEIAAGALADRDLELIWVDDPVDAFFLEIQGSGLVEMADGQRIGVGYAGQNGHGYVPIGRVLIDWGEATPEDMSMELIRGWLAANPSRARDLMDANPSYVFFEQRSPDAVLGNLEVPLTPERSLAVDWRYVPRGAPFWLDIAADPTVPDGRLRRLMVAQDTGGAIRGPVAGDVFWGYGPSAGIHAGPMRASGRAFVLVPRGGPG